MPIQSSCAPRAEIAAALRARAGVAACPGGGGRGRCIARGKASGEAISGAGAGSSSSSGGGGHDRGPESRPSRHTPCCRPERGAVHHDPARGPPPYPLNVLPLGYRLRPPPWNLWFFNVLEAGRPHRRKRRNLDAGECTAHLFCRAHERGVGCHRVVDRYCLVERNDRLDRNGPAVIRRTGPLAGARQRRLSNGPSLLGHGTTPAPRPRPASAFAKLYGTHRPPLPIRDLWNRHHGRPARPEDAGKVARRGPCNGSGYARRRLEARSGHSPPFLILLMASLDSRSTSDFGLGAYDGCGAHLGAGLDKRVTA